MERIIIESILLITTIVIFCVVVGKLIKNANKTK